VNLAQAEKYIRHLASTYNYILNTNNTKAVRLNEELDLVRAYFFMHKIRYENRIELSIDEKLDNVAGYIPPLVLQILVENAFKHSIISEIQPLKIEIFKNGDNWLTVRNNIIRNTDDLSTMNVLLNKQKESESYKVGLSNIISRYSYFTTQKIEVSSGKHFTVRVPIIQEYNEG